MGQKPSISGESCPSWHQKCTQSTIERGSISEGTFFRLPEEVIEYLLSTCFTIAELIRYISLLNKYWFNFILQNRLKFFSKSPSFRVLSLSLEEASNKKEVLDAPCIRCSVLKYAAYLFSPEWCSSPNIILSNNNRTVENTDGGIKSNRICINKSIHSGTHVVSFNIDNWSSNGSVFQVSPADLDTVSSLLNKKIIISKESESPDFSQRSAVYFYSPRGKASFTGDKISIVIIGKGDSYKVSWFKNSNYVSTADIRSEGGVYVIVFMCGEQHKISIIHPQRGLIVPEPQKLQIIQCEW